MKINTKIILKSLKGEPLKDTDGTPALLGDAIGNILISHEAGGKMKCFVLGQKFATADSVEVDDADLSLIKQAVEATKIYNALVAGQVLTILESSVDKK